MNLPISEFYRSAYMKYLFLYQLKFYVLVRFWYIIKIALFSVLLWESVTEFKCPGTLSYKIIWPASTDCKSPNLPSDQCGSACEVFGHGFQIQASCAFWFTIFFIPCVIWTFKIEHNCYFAVLVLSREHLRGLSTFCFLFSSSFNLAAFYSVSKS